MKLKKSQKGERERERERFVLVVYSWLNEWKRSQESRVSVTVWVWKCECDGRRRRNVPLPCLFPSFSCGFHAPRIYLSCPLLPLHCSSWHLLRFRLRFCPLTKFGNQPTNSFSLSHLTLLYNILEIIPACCYRPGPLKFYAEGANIGLAWFWKYSILLIVTGPGLANFEPRKLILAWLDSKKIPCLALFLTVNV